MLLVRREREGTDHHVIKMKGAGGDEERREGHGSGGGSGIGDGGLGIGTFGVISHGTGETEIEKTTEVASGGCANYVVTSGELLWAGLPTG